jgi:type VI secretion system protein ImpG
MSFNVYYQNELLALRELGKEFAQRNPALAPFFDTPGRDPDVERLLEGFAFLSGRLRQKLDDELPELTHSLFNLLWPNYLRPIPASSIIRYLPGDSIAGSVIIPRGSMVDSVAVQGVKCRFSTVYQTEILPLSITGQRIIEHGGEASIALGFATRGPLLGNIPLTSLRFYLVGDPIVAHTLYITMLDRVKTVRIVMRDALKQEHVVAELAPKYLRPVGFREEEGLYPYPANTFPGHRILQEFFCFPEKFHFVELSGLEQGLKPKTHRDFQGATEFEIHFVLKELPEQYQSFRAENWQLFCTPVVNLFPMDASPLTLDHSQTEYRIVPDPRLPYHYATYSVNRIGSWGQDDKSDLQYLPFESFEHEAEADKTPFYYRLHLRPSLKDEATETYISLVQTPESRVLPQKQTISLELTCTNRLLPKELRVGDICVPAENNSAKVGFKNITPVIPSFRPPMDGDLLWQLISNMSLNYVSLTSVPALRVVLKAYDFRALHDRPRARILEKTLNGIVRISCSETDRIYGGLPVRGAQTRLVLDQRAFSCEGGMYLFGSVLNDFFALHATINSFHQLIVEEATCGEQYRWPARLGRTVSL